MNRIALAVVAYLIGSFPTGVVFTRRKYGIDVREMGSGNIGATNVTRVFGWYAGVLVFIVDFIKGYVPVVYIQRAYPEDPWLITIAGTALVFGHCFSLYLKGRGGKGVATDLGVMTAAYPIVALIGVVVYVPLLILTRISAVGSLCGIAASLAYVILSKPPEPIFYLSVATSIIVIFRHHRNIRRLGQDVRAKLNKGA